MGGGVEEGRNRWEKGKRSRELNKAEILGWIVCRGKRGMRRLKGVEGNG